EGKMGVAGVTARVGVGQRRDHQGADMRRHVQTVREERHGAKDRTADHLGGHHGPAETDDGPRFPLVSAVILAKKNVFVSESREGVYVHSTVLLPTGSEKIQRLLFRCSKPLQPCATIP